MEPNPYRGHATKAWVIATACAFAFVVLLPIATLGRLSFLLMMGTIFSATGSLIAVFTGWSLGKTAEKFDDLLDGRDVLVRWTCDEARWHRFLLVDTRARRSKARSAMWFLGLMVALFVGAAIAVYIDDPGALELSAFFLILGAGFALFAWMLRASILPKATHSEAPSTAHISRNGMVFRGKYIAWRAFGVGFRGARIDAGKTILRITYEVSTNEGSVTHDALVPIPEGREDEARELVRRLE